MRARRGIAVVAALSLMLLTAALLATAAISVSASARAVLGQRAALAAESGARRALAHMLLAWSPAADTLPVGAAEERALLAWELEATEGMPLAGRARVQRLGPTLFALSADVRAGASGSLARRRVRLLVQRPPVRDSSAAASPPAPISRWSVADLY